MFGTGSIEVLPGLTTCPATSCGPESTSSVSEGSSGSCAIASLAMTSRTRLDVELPKIFRAEILEVALELIGRHLILGGCGARARRRIGFPFLRRVLEDKRRQERILCVHRRRESKCDRDTVGWACVDVDDLFAAVNLKLGVVGAVFDFGDLDSTENSAQARDQSLAEIVSKGSVPPKLAHLYDDGLGFGLSDPDGKQPLAALFLEYHDIGVVRPVEPKAHHFHFGQLHF